MKKVFKIYFEKDDELTFVTIEAQTSRSAVKEFKKMYSETEYIKIKDVTPTLSDELLDSIFDMVEGATDTEIANRVISTIKGE